MGKQVDLFQEEQKESNGASFSKCMKYRYALWRIWDESKPLVMFIGLNPSTANQNTNDATINSVTRISKYNGYGGFYMMNCFPLVSTDPARLQEVYDCLHETEDIENMKWLLEVSRKCKEVVFAWGNFKIVEQRANSISGYFKNAKALFINKNGSPKHPLYCKGNTDLINYQ